MEVSQHSDLLETGDHRRGPLHVRMIDLGRARPSSVWYFIGKRTMDLVLSIALLVMLSPLLLVVAIAIKFDSAGPVLFKQTRMGARRVEGSDDDEMWALTPFNVYKFRSMRSDADSARHIEYIRRYTQNTISAAADGTAAMYKMVSDPRVTRIGRLLRRLSIDELPQLLNVVKGDMSLVGPRPVPLYEVAEYGPEHYARLASRPGITGLWQVAGRGRVTFDEMVALDVALIRRRSLLYEVGILLRTLPVVVRGTGAH